MSAKIDDGGAAFPMAGSTASWDPEKVQFVRQYGMTLRDWFAGQALAGLLANGGAAFWDRDAQNAYAAADVMLAARKGGSND